MDINIKNIIQEIHDETSIPKEVIENIVKSEFDFVTYIMSDNSETHEDSTILLNYLGKFMVKKNRRKYRNVDRKQKLPDTST